MLFITWVVFTTVVVPVVIGGYTYGTPSTFLELPTKQANYNYGSSGVKNAYRTNVQSFNNYHNIYTGNIRNTVNAQQAVQTSYNVQVQPSQVYPPMTFKEQRQTVYPAATGVQPPNRGIPSPGGVRSHVISNYHDQTAAPVYYGYRPVVSPVSNITPQTIQQQNQINRNQVINQEIVHHPQQQYKNVQVSHEHVVQDSDEETIFEEEEISYNPNFDHTYVNQPQNVKLSNTAAVSSIIGNNVAQNNVVNTGGVNLDRRIPSFGSPQTVVTKHVYFHVPPPDIEENHAVNSVSLAPKKTFNIIFIKVPSQEYLDRTQVLGQLQGRQNSVDKTLIYVLVKKQDALQTPTGQPSQPTKPEVFFVKYKGEPRVDV